MSEANAPSGKSGSIVLNQSPPSSSAPLSASTIRISSNLNHRRVPSSFVFIRTDSHLCKRFRIECESLWLSLSLWLTRDGLSARPSSYSWTKSTCSRLSFLKCVKSLHSWCVDVSCPSPTRFHLQSSLKSTPAVPMLTRQPNISSGSLCRPIGPDLVYTLSESPSLLRQTRNVFFWYATSLTQATDTTNIRLVFAAVKETILQNALKDSGIL